jgi:phage terminase large subunit
MDPASYAWIWEGAYLTNSDAQVLAGKVSVQEFEPLPDWNGPYFGFDWGFAQDPTTGVKCWVSDGVLYIEHEAYQVGLELDDTAALMMAKLPDAAAHKGYGDSARPETISYLKRHGLPRLESVAKWAGSVEDGVQFLRSFKQIVVHPRCRETIKESRLYSYKVDRLTGDILPTIVDANNHIMDAVRYALSPMIKTPPAFFIG